MAENTTRNFTFESIDRISFSALGTVHLIQDGSESIQVEGPEDTLDHVKVDQSGSTLHVRLFTWYDFFFIPRPATYTIHVKNINAFSVAGSADVDCQSLDATGHRLELNISGSGKMSFGAIQAGDLVAASSGSGRFLLESIRASAVDVEFSGAGNYRLQGLADHLKIRVSGSGDVEAIDLAVKATDIQITGSGRISTQAAERLDVSISGSGEVTYSGEPHINQSISGSGKIRRR